MRKYRQIVLVLLGFGALLLFRNVTVGGGQATVRPAAGGGSGNPPPPAAPDPAFNSGGGSGTGGTAARGRYRDGTYTGDVADAYYGNVQVQVTVSGGKISDVQFLQYPNDNRTSQFINSQAMPVLRSEAISAQSANVDGVSGASATSGAFIQSLGSALSKAG